MNSIYMCIAMSYQALRWAAHLWVILACTAVHAAQPFDIVTEQGKYRVIELAHVTAPFELTEDLAWAVTHVNQEFHVHSVKDDRPLEKTLKLEARWKVMGQELVVATENRWEHYSLPDLQLVRKADFPTPGNGAALVHGWIAGDLIVDDDHTTILASLRGPYSENWSRNYVHLRKYVRDSTASILPMQIQVTEDAITLEGYDTLPILGPDKPKFRCGPNWFSLAGKRQERSVSPTNCAVFVQLIETHFDQLHVPGRLHWWPSIPTFFDKETDVKSWKRVAMPGRQPVADAFTLDPTADTAGPKSENQFIAALNRASLDKVDKVIEDYVKIANPEFKLATGRDAKLIPMAFVVSFRSEPFSEQVVWTEMTKAEIINRFAQPMLRREAKAKVDVAVAEHEQNRQRLQEAANAISSENARQAKEPLKFSGNFRTYAGYAGIITLALVLTVLCAILTYQRSRKFRAEPPVVVV